MSKKLYQQRARNLEAKNAKRDLILLESLKLFGFQDFDSISMESIARNAGLAKGTLYLYFKTKEEVFLECTQRIFSEWVLTVKLILSDSPSRLTNQKLAEIITDSLNAQPKLPMLLSHLHVVLEKNISATAARQFKYEFKSQLEELADQLDGKVSALPSREASVSFLMKSYALLVGMHQLCNPHPRIQEVLKDPALSLFVLDFAEQMKSGLKLLLLGFEKQENKNTYHLFGNY